MRHCLWKPRGSHSVMVPLACPGPMREGAAAGRAGHSSFAVTEKQNIHYIVFFKCHSYLQMCCGHMSTKCASGTKNASDWKYCNSSYSAHPGWQLYDGSQSLHMLRGRAEQFPFVPGSGRNEEAKGLSGFLVRVTMKYYHQRQCRKERIYFTHGST